MKVKDCMTKHVISVGTQEPVSVAARLMSRYNLGILPVQTPDGRLCGMVTDRDVVLRCVAAGKDAEAVPVREIMSTGVLAVEASDDTARAARLMSRAAAPPARHAERASDRHALAGRSGQTREFQHGDGPVHGVHLQPGRPSGLTGRKSRKNLRFSAKNHLTSQNFSGIIFKPH